jgi:hypothetical protein
VHVVTLVADGVVLVDPPPCACGGERIAVRLDGNGVGVGYDASDAEPDMEAGVEQESARA